VTASDASSSAALAAQVERLHRVVETVEQTAASAAQTAAASKATGETLAQQIAALRSEVAGLAALGHQVGVLADRVTELAAGESGSEAPRVLSWFDADAEQAPELLADVAQWAYAVFTRYTQGRSVLSNCWQRHPAAVEALNALHTAWLAIYRASDGRPAAAVDWHVRMLPGTLDLLRAEVDRCDELQHAPGGTAVTFDADNPRPVRDPEQIADYADWWATTRGDDSAEPEPGLPARTPDTAPRPTPPAYGGAGYGSARHTQPPPNGSTP
jgi:hypothetical protein